MAKLLISFFVFLIFFNISFAERKTFLTEKQKDELYLLLKEDLVQIKKFRNYVNKNKNHLRKDKIFLIKLLILNYRLDNINNLLELINKLPTNKYSDPLEKNIILLISNYVLLNFDSEKAIKDFKKNFDKYITLLPPEKFHIYTNTAFKIEDCNFALKLISYEFAKRLSNPFFKDRIYKTAYCFYKKNEYSNAYLIFNRLAFIYPNFKKKYVKQYLIDLYLKINKKSPIIRDENFKDFEKFLFKLSIFAPNQDTRTIYLDLLSKSKEGINDKLFNRGILILDLLKNKQRYNYYLANLINQNLKYLSKKENYFIAVENYLFAKKKGLKPSEIKTKERTFLLKSLIKHSYYIEGYKIYSIGNIDIKNTTNAILTLFLKLNKKIPNKVLNEIEKQKNTNPKLLLKYFTKIEPNINKSKYYLVESLKENKNINFLPYYINLYFRKVKLDKLNYYKEITRFSLNNNNFTIFLDYLLAAYERKNYKLAEGIISKFDNSSISDAFTQKVVSYVRNAISYRNHLKNDTDLTIDDKLDLYTLWNASIKNQ